MKANYKNWVPKGMATGFAAGAAALAAGSAGLAVFGKGKAAKTAAAVSALGAVGCGAWAAARGLRRVGGVVRLRAAAVLL